MLYFYTYTLYFKIFFQKKMHYSLVTLFRYIENKRVESYIFDILYYANPSHTVNFIMVLYVEYSLLLH